MTTRIVTWNVNRAGARRKTWEYLRILRPDIALLQEVGDYPVNDFAEYQTLEKQPATRSGGEQRFRSLMMVRGSILDHSALHSEQRWVREVLRRFDGNVYSAAIQTSGGHDLQILHAYCPPWPIRTDDATPEEIKSVRFAGRRSVWLTDVILSELRRQPQIADGRWIIAGDLNLSETLDRPNQQPRGNKHFLDSMASLGLTECLRHHNGKLVPTYRHSTGSILHQIDHIFLSRALFPSLTGCVTPSIDAVFSAEGSLSDHLPVIADLEL
jgi:exonuclease III